MSNLALWFGGWALIAGILGAVWVVQLRTRNAGVVDVFWPLSIGAAGVLFACLAEGNDLARLCVGLLSAIWALRLGGYLALRNIGKPEDARYRKLREEWGDKANPRMLGFYQVQALSGALLAISPLVAAAHPQLGLPQALAGLLVGFIGVAGEALADQQLARFKRDPQNRGRVCNRGLWYYSRHPNYFFESLYWCAYAVLAVGAPWMLLSLTGPVLITFFLLRFTGIPATEAQACRTRGAEYTDYISRTSAFIPWFPKSPK